MSSDKQNGVGLSKLSVEKGMVSGLGDLPITLAIEQFVVVVPGTKYRSNQPTPIWACPPAPRHATLRNDAIYSRQSEEPKTGCQREPTAPLALTSSERHDQGHFARPRPLRRTSRPKQHRDFQHSE